MEIRNEIIIIKDPLSRILKNCQNKVYPIKYCTKHISNQTFRKITFPEQHLK